MKSKFISILILFLLCASTGEVFANKVDDKTQNDSLLQRIDSLQDTIRMQNDMLQSKDSILSVQDKRIATLEDKSSGFQVWAIASTVLFLIILLYVGYFILAKKKRIEEKKLSAAPITQDNLVGSSNPELQEKLTSEPHEQSGEINNLQNQLADANAGIAELKEQQSALNEENQRLEAELKEKEKEIDNLLNYNNSTKKSESLKNVNDTYKNFVDNLKLHLRKEYGVIENDVNNIVEKQSISKLIAVIISSFISKKTSKLSEIVGTLPNDIEKQINLIEDGIKRLLKEKKEIEEHPCKYIKYPSPDKEEKEILSSLVVRILSEKITGLKQYEGKSFQELADAIQLALTRKSEEEVIAGALSKGEVVRKDDMANTICQQINEQVKIDSLALEAKSVEELVNCVSEKLQQQVDQVTIDAIASERAKEQIEEGRKDSLTQIESLTEQLGAAKKDVDRLSSEKEQLEKDVQKANDDLDQAKNKFNEEKAQLQEDHQKELDERKNTYENNKRQLEEKHESEKKELIEQHSSDIQKLKQEHELTLSMEQEKATAEKNKALEELTKTKDAEISKVTAEKDAKVTELENEKGEHSQTKESLKLAMTGYAALIKNTFEQLNNTISKAEENSDASASKLVAKIVENKAYGLEEFMEAISKISGKDAEVDFATYNLELKNCVLECLETKQPTWIDWLVRLAQYANVPFIAEQFAQQNLSLVGVGEALQATKTILHSLGIQLEYPMLFKDTISDKYSEESIRNIDSYVNDIASHCSGQKGLIVDIYKAGYSVDGEQKRKPIVSKFN